MRGGKDEDTSNENLQSMGNGERGYCHSNAVPQPHMCLNTIPENGVQQGGSTVGMALSLFLCVFVLPSLHFPLRPWAWLSVVLSKHFFVKGTAPAKKEADLCRNNPFVLLL